MGKSKRKARSFLESAQRIPESAAPPFLFADPSVLVWLGPWAEGRGPRERGERRGRGSRKRDTHRQVGPREEPAAAMVTVAFPPRLVAMETPRGPLSFTFACPLSVSFVLPAPDTLPARPPPRCSLAPALAISRPLSLSPDPTLPPRVSPRRANSPSFSLPLAFARIPSVPSSEEEERARDKEERDREKRGKRAHARYSCLPRRAWTSPVAIVRLVID